MAAQAVALIPGFLGFNHRRGTTYFADRFVAGLRTRLEQEYGAPFPVVPVSTLPISSLADRQQKLLDNLAELDRKLGMPMWHLLGHSTGGVDAALLARTHRLKKVHDGSAFSSEPLDFSRLASVTTLSAPHYGTCLALSPFASFVRGKRSRAGLSELLIGIGDTLRRDKLGSRLAFILPSLGHTSGFYQNFFRGPLITDLEPRVVGALTRTDNRRPGIPIASFATFAPPPSEHPEDPLFADLWRFTAEKAVETAPPPQFPEVSPEQVISRAPRVPIIDARSNDAIVNTSRQVDARGTFGGLIVGDHGDVIGRYRRNDVLDGKLIDPGLLTSGAQFGDDEFFAVLDRIADAIPAMEMGGVAGRAAE